MAVLNGHVETILTLELPLLVRISLLIDPLDQILVFVIQVAATRRRLLIAFVIHLFDLVGDGFLLRELGTFHKLFDCGHLLVLISLCG